MKLYFNEIKIHNFQSIGSATISLSNTGIVYVKGENLYEEFTESNGSGKSSIFESILWCLFGKTSAGVSDVKNHYMDDGCFVELEIFIDNVPYKIRRAQSHKEYKSNIYISRSGEDISGRNKTDSNKIILDILKVDIDIFMSIIILSQGFSSKLSTLTPTNRKDRLEKLAGSSSVIEEFKELLTDSKNKENDNLREADIAFGENTGRFNNTKELLDSLQVKLNDLLEKSTKDIPDLKQVRDDLDSNQEKLLEILNNKTETVDKFNSISNKLNNIKKDISSFESKKEQALDKLQELEKENRCYTCGQIIDQDISDKLKLDIQDDLESYDSSISELKESSSSLRSDIVELQNIKADIESKESSLQDTIKGLQDILEEFSDYEDIDEIDNIKKDIETNSKTLEELETEVDKAKETVDKISHNIEIYTNCIYLTTKDFREYLLNNVIKFLNNRLYNYSKMLYNNSEVDYIHIEPNLNIFVGEYEYSSLSGGEKRKADIALVFAQRDLALNISGMNCNLLVLDEIYDNLDELAISNVSNLISQISDIDSMFVISHMKNVDIKYDTILKVTKDKTRISAISYE